MIYEICFYVPYEGIVENFILEHENKMSENELNEIVKSALKKYTKEVFEKEYSDCDWLELEDTFIEFYKLDDYLCKNYGFKKVEVTSVSFDRFTRYNEI